MSVPPKSIFSLLSFLYYNLTSPMLSFLKQLCELASPQLTASILKELAQVSAEFVFLQKESSSQSSTDCSETLTDLLRRQLHHLATAVRVKDRQIVLFRSVLGTKFVMHLLMLTDLYFSNYVIGLWSCFEMIIICETIQSKCNNNYFSFKK